jgi:hypothetical protein
VVPGPEISSNPQVLMTNLAELDFSGAALSPEQITLWKQSLQKLVLLGPASLPAVTEFLNRNVDVDFDPGKGGDQLGYATLRLALFDVLRQINSPESIAASGQALQATGDPREIAVLAKNNRLPANTAKKLWPPRAKPWRRHREDNWTPMMLALYSRSCNNLGAQGWCPSWKMSVQNGIFMPPSLLPSCGTARAFPPSAAWRKAVRFPT